jgi:hybrid cluster-associated redox disulfide protein
MNTGGNMANFTPEMTVAQAMEAHPKAREVFAGFHLGGCAHCAISEFETIQQVCDGYGVPVEMLIDTLESLAEEKK